MDFVTLFYGFSLLPQAFLLLVQGFDSDSDSDCNSGTGVSSLSNSRVGEDREIGVPVLS